jgi:Rrf2 family protein
MQITRATDYAVRAMVHLACLPPGDKMQLNELIEATGVRGSFLSKVVQRLVHAGMVTSHRGTRGGFSLRVPGQDVTLLDVVEAIEGPTQLNLCLGAGETCERKSWCGVHPVWQKAQLALTEVLGGVTVAQLAKDTKARKAELEMAAGSKSTSRADQG